MSQPGDLLAERWRLVEKIDAGAMGEIFRGTHDLLGHAVAIKVLMPEIARDKAAVERFLREARIAAKLSNKHVVRVEDYGVAADGRPFLVMELLRGESLARRMERAAKVPQHEVVEIVRQIGVGLDAAHAAGIVHRDLKPENVFLVTDNDGRMLVKVLDFGVAKFTDTLAAAGRATASNTLVGTPRYMSPEQARSSRELDGRSDLWALGIMTYEMLAGRHPFESEAIAELLVAILTHRIAGPTAINPELPCEIDGFMTRALARNRAERFSTAQEFCVALEEALESPPREESTGRRSRTGTPRMTRVSLNPEVRGERNATPLMTQAPAAVRSSGKTPLQTPFQAMVRSSLETSMAAPVAFPNVAAPVSAKSDETGPMGVSLEASRSGRIAQESRRGSRWALTAVVAVALTLVLLVRGRTPTPAARPVAIPPMAVVAMAGTMAGAFPDVPAPVVGRAVQAPAETQVTAPPALDAAVRVAPEAGARELRGRHRSSEPASDRRRHGHGHGTPGGTLPYDPRTL